MIAALARCLVGVALLPACWGCTRALIDAVFAGTAGGISVEAVSLLAGLVAFALCWATLPHPVRTYVLGHELTHALWGLLFGACPSDVRVSASGGNVRLTKTNAVIALAPYFFPFYTFVVILVALVMSAFVRPLPFLPLWMFLVGFTWAFHVLFTLQTLTQRQPDIKPYGRLFSWSVIFIVNIALVLLWLAATTPLTFPQLGAVLTERLLSAYMRVGLSVWNAGVWCVRHIVSAV
jgi:hypothetical protein